LLLALCFSHRFAVVFTFNTFGAMALGTIVQLVATAHNLDTIAYYRLLAGGQCFLAVALCLWCALPPSCTHAHERRAVGYWAATSDVLEDEEDKDNAAMHPIYQD
jgi:hypothetical protein